MIEHVWPRFRVLHYLLSESHGKTVAHCLDLDLVATADATREAVRRLDVLVKGHVEFALWNGNFLALMTPAPLQYWKYFAEGERINLETPAIQFRMPDVVPLEEEGGELAILAAQQLQYAVQ